MPANNNGAAAPKILIVGGGYAGFYTAFKLEKLLGKGEAEVTLVDPLPYLTYQPFLPEVVAGSIEARHVVTSHRRHLRKTNIVAGKVTHVDHAGVFTHANHEVLFHLRRNFFTELTQVDFRRLVAAVL